MDKEKKQKKLHTRIIIRCVMMAVIICAAVCISGYIQYRNSIYRTYNSFGYQIGEVALSFVDGDTIAGYLETGETDEAYDRMAADLYNLYKKSGIRSIYIYIPDAENLTMLNIYDARIKDAENPEIYALGAVDPISASPNEVIRIFRTGVRSKDYFIRKNSFGYNTSAILPVFDSNNKVSAMLSVDIPMPKIEKNLLRYLYTTIIITIVIVAVFILVLQIMLKKKIITPLKIITDEVSAFIESEKTISEKLEQIKTHDEIEILASSILKMEKDINRYIDDITAITTEKERIGAELNVATKIQASMLPCIFPPYPGRNEFDIYATMTPAKEVGGDFYDFFMVDDDHFAMVMADVSGKGVPAAMFMVVAKTLLKNMSQLGNGTVEEILGTVNYLLCENNEADMFVTVWLGIVELSTGKLTAANAGHEYPVLRRAGGDYKLIKDKHGFVLAGMDGSNYKSYEIQLEKGDRLYLYTDGVTEATNAGCELFGNERMMNALNENKDAGLAELLQNVKKRIDEFVGDAPQFDDITMMAFEYRGKDDSVPKN